MSDIENYKATRSTSTNSIPTRNLPINSTRPIRPSNKSGTIVEQIFDAIVEKQLVDTDNDSVDLFVDPNNDPQYYYCSIRIGDKNISVKLRVSLIAYAIVVLGLRENPNNPIAHLRRDIQKILYNLMKGYKFPKENKRSYTKGTNAIITDKLIEYLIEQRYDEVDSTDYRIYCSRLGGQVNENSETTETDKES
jgi:hypothetical protein